MKKLQLSIIAILFFMCGFAQTNPCGSIINDTFDTAGALPSEWTEYNTAGSVTVADGKLKFEHNKTMPSAYRTLTPVTSNAAFSFDVKASRNTVNCQIHLVSSTGKHLTSFAMGKGSTSIKIATTLEGGVPSGYTDGIPEITLIKDTDYSISAQIDFATKKVNFYNAGALVYEGAPFLEDAEDIAKIDIQLIYMYSDNGQFYFDNIAILSANENRILLQSNVGAAETLLSTVSVGENYGQYSQSAVDTFQTGVNQANTVLVNCNATSIAIDSALTDLQAAKEAFEAARVNDPVLKIYSDYNFSGTEHQMYCGHYNGTLAEYNDWAASFTLDKGYMVTFAENINGTGVSKVYIASKENLRINLPAELQKTVSFIRVSPWKDVLKKGIGAKGDAVVEALNNSWHYNWGNDGEAIGGAEFVPNQWSGGSVAKAISLGERMDITHHMAFNEPDNEDQSNMTVDTAIEKYEYLLASGLRLGSPANTDGTKGATWRDEFMTKAEEKGLRVDYMVVHYYKKTTPAGFYNWLKAIYDKWHRPIWIKEFNYGATWVSNKPATNQEASDGLESYINKLDETSFIERYAVFTWQPDSEVYSLMSVRYPVTLSASGVMYRDHISPVAYTQEVYEQGANLSVGKNSISSKVIVYPTVVTTGILNVKYSEELNNKNIELTFYNTMGQQVKKVVGLETRVDVGSLSNGLYMIKIESDLGSSTKRMIIQ